MKQPWIMAKPNSVTVKGMAGKCGISELTAKLLVNRGWNIPTAEKLFMNTQSLLASTPLSYENQAVELLLKHCSDPAGEIWIYADYDVDGMTSGYILARALRTISKCPVWVHFPEREEKYGIHLDFCRQVADRCIGAPMLVITVDNGVAAVDEIRQLHKDGVETLILDHHLPKEVLPPGIIVNPHVHHDPADYLAGCGVAWRIIRLLSEKRPEINPAEYLPAAAMGTIADMMEMSPENQAIAQLGIAQLNDVSGPRVIRSWKHFLGLDDLTPADIAWELAPRMNACGRMGQIQKSAQLLFFEPGDSEVEMKDCFLEIEEINEARKGLSKQAAAAIAKKDFSNDAVIIFDASDFPSGIAGIIAGKLAEEYGRPAMALSGDEIMSGSCRIPDGIPFTALLQQELLGGRLLHFGGHDAACGVSVERDQLEELRQSLTEALNAMAPPEKVEKPLKLDAELSLGDLNSVVFDQVGRLAYDNQNFCEPVFSLSNLDVKKVTGSKANPQNLKFSLRDSGGIFRDIWAWRFKDHYDAIGKPSKIHLAGQLTRDFMDRRRITLRILDMKPAV